MKTAVQVTMYLDESGQVAPDSSDAQKRKRGRRECFSRDCRFTGRNSVHTASLVEAGGNLPVVVVFVDVEEHGPRSERQKSGLGPILAAT